MKLKDFVSGSLPRGNRSKNKKNSTSQTLNNIACSPNQRDPMNILDTVPKVSNGNAVTINSSLVSEDFKYIEEKLSPLKICDTFNVNFNVNTVDSKCACYKHINPGCPEILRGNAHQIVEYSPEWKEATNALITSLGGDANCNSLPRTRTRIKTNPWLPSPRTTPNQTPSVSPQSSMVSSPSYSPTLKRKDRSFESDDGFVGGADSDSTISFSGGSVDSAVETSIKCDRQNSETGSLASNMSCEELESPLQCSFTSETDNSVTANEHCKQFAYLLDTEDGISSCENLDALDVERIIDLGQQAIEHEVSFEYEEAFESKIECRDVADVVGSRDSLSSGYGPGYYGSRDYLDYSFSGSLTSSPSEQSMTLSRDMPTDLEDDEEDDIWESDEEEIWKLDEDGSPQDDTDEKSFLAQLNEKVAEKGDPPTVWEKREEIPDEEEPTVPRQLEMETSFADDASFDSAYVTGTFNNDITTPLVEQSRLPVAHGSSSRTVAQIRSSLQEKVSLLRREKLVVDQKVQAAKEEESIREQEKQRFQKQMTLHRKQLLLRTLQDLKQKLENQSQRLQNTYSNVLTMQKNFMKSKKNTSDKKPVLEADLNKEAPF